ncbi:hypothetical protein [Gloeothece citriformis]|uniref:hypothetical protein n=1 Tax=Gloeothece citriformis TaxID=2546356 RepID=UPI00059E4328|nr:hypothetical protein [Gloeothece citriformis]
MIILLFILNKPQDKRQFFLAAQGMKISYREDLNKLVTPSAFNLLPPALCVLPSAIIIIDFVVFFYGCWVSFCQLNLLVCQFSIDGEWDCGERGKEIFSSSKTFPQN